MVIPKSSFNGTSIASNVGARQVRSFRLNRMMRPRDARFSPLLSAKHPHSTESQVCQQTPRRQTKEAVQKLL